jgi:predicted  nucleic acid-binding Zn ribbon protein
MRVATGPEVVDSVRPKCPSCGVEMWLKGMDRRTPAVFHFQCTVCSAVEVVAASE